MVQHLKLVIPIAKEIRKARRQSGWDDTWSLCLKEGWEVYLEDCLPEIKRMIAAGVTSWEFDSCGNLLWEAVAPMTLQEVEAELSKYPRALKDRIMKMKVRKKSNNPLKVVGYINPANLDRGGGFEEAYALDREMDYFEEYSDNN